MTSLTRSGSQARAATGQLAVARGRSTRRERARTCSEIDVEDCHALSLPPSVVLVLVDPVSCGCSAVPDLPPALVHVERVLSDQVRPRHVQERILGHKQHLARHAVIDDLSEGDKEEGHVGREEEHEQQVESEVERQRRARRRELVHLRETR